MKFYSFYHTQTGILHQNKFGTSDPTQLANNVPADHAPIDGHLDHLAQRVDVDKLKAEGATVATIAHVIDYRPASPSADHEWNASTKRWQLSGAAQSKQDARRMALAQIAALEARQPRAIREAFLGYDGAAARVKDIDAQIISLREKL